MFDDENNQDGALQETIAAADVQEQDEEQLTQEENQQDSEAPPRSNKDENFRRLREKTERLERERDDAIRLAQSIYAQTQQVKSPAAPVEDEDLKFADTDLVEGTHINKVTKKIKRLESQLKEYERKSDEYSIEARLKSKFSDFDAVVNVDNLKTLRELEPDVADAILAAPDLYKQGVLAYNMVKKLNLVSKDQYEKNHEHAQKNAAKPRSTSSINSQHGQSPLTKANAFANGLTDELRTQLLKEMTEARKGL